MMHGSLIKLRLWTLCAALLTSLPSCQPIPAKVVAPPPQQSNETAKAICEVWGKTSPTWADEDTEETKDQIDHSIRSYEAVCKGYGA
jgi:hypothetical protein